MVQAVAWTRKVDDFTALGYRVATISYDGVGALSRFSNRRKSKLIHLADPRSEAIRAFGVLNPNYPPGSPGHGVAVPIVFAIGPDGVITHRFSVGNYQDRPDIGRVMEVLRAGLAK